MNIAHLEGLILGLHFLVVTNNNSISFGFVAQGFVVKGFGIAFLYGSSSFGSFGQGSLNFAKEGILEKFNLFSQDKPIILNVEENFTFVNA